MVLYFININDLLTYLTFLSSSTVVKLAVTFKNILILFDGFYDKKSLYKYFPREIPCPTVKSSLK